jgi:hypothetical protein
VPLASASGALVLIGLLFHDKKNTLGSGLWQAFSSIKKTLRCSADPFLDQENPLASGGPFPRSRIPSGARQAFSSIKKTLWRLADLFLDQENSLVLGWH